MTTKYFKTAYSTESTDENGKIEVYADTRSGTHMSYEDALKQAQVQADKDRRDIQILAVIANVKYPTPSFPVEKIS